MEKPIFLTLALATALLASLIVKSDTRSQNSEIETEDADVIRARIQWFKENHPELDAKLKLRIAREGYEQRELEKIRAQTAALTGSWVSIGPTNGAGRISSIAVHPTIAGTLSTGADGGGVWKTTDGGNSWSTLTDSINNLSVGAIAIAPSSPNLIYVGTGSEHSSGIGLLRSTDGGNTWLFPATVVAGRFWRLSVHPTDPLDLLAATDSGVLRSTDGGQNWRVTLGSIAAEDVERDPTNPLVVYVA
ncbi:MAG TPA: hypothetical protein VIV66_12490, partial [Pyrinomonadaceae bacterium]